MSKTDTFFSIIVPAFNRELYLARCIGSIKNQTYQNWEAIIVDDGSTDNTSGLVQEFTDSRIKYYYKENGGASSARNVGIDNSNGSYIAFLDSDDEYKQDHLLYIYNFLKRKDFPECLVFTDFAKNLDGKIIYGDTSDFLKTKPNFCNLPYIPTTAIHKHAIGNDRFNEDLIFREDSEFLDRIRYKVPCYRIKNYSVIIHRHDSNITSNILLSKKEMEKSIYYYIRTRKKFSMKELSELYNIYSYLTLHYFRDKNGIETAKYFTKMILSSPICLFHYPSLKITLRRFTILLGARKKTDQDSVF